MFPSVLFLSILVTGRGQSLFSTSLGSGETKLNPTLHPAVALPLMSVHTDCSHLACGTASALPCRSCSGIGLHGHSTPTPLDQTGIGKHREGGQVCAALATTPSMHMNMGDVPNRHTPEPELCTGWGVRTRLKTTCLIQGVKPAQFNSHPHAEEQKSREAISAPSKDPASLQPWDSLLGACSWGCEGSFITGGFCSCLVQHLVLPVIFSALI